MAQSQTTIVLAYHGTTLKSAERILKGDPIRQSENPWDWLGPGVYFWQDAPYLALHWANKFLPPGETPAVLEAQIAIHKCFDLFDLNLMPVLEDCWQRVQRNCQADASPIPIQVPFDVTNGTCVMPPRWGHNYADRALFRELIALSRTEPEPFDCIRAAFLEGQALHSTSFVFDKAHVQISVVNRNIITWEGLYAF